MKILYYKKHYDNLPISVITSLVYYLTATKSKKIEGKSGEAQL